MIIIPIVLVILNYSYCEVCDTQTEINFKCATHSVIDSVFKSAHRS